MVGLTTHATTPEPITWLKRGQTMFKAQADECVVGFDWSAERITPAVPTIRTSVWRVEGGDGVLRVDQPGIDRHRTHAMLVGGSPGLQYLITNSVTMGTPAQREDRAFFVSVTR